LTDFHHWPNLVGYDCGFQAVGLPAFTPPNRHHHLATDVAMQHAAGVLSQFGSCVNAYITEELDKLEQVLLTGNFDLLRKVKRVSCLGHTRAKLD
jgi:hypothetical protein